MLANWLIIAGLVFLILGFTLRTIMMMRSSDATAPETRVLHGRELLRQYRKQFPRSATPVFTLSLLTGGAMLLLAGLTAEFSH